MRRSVKGTDLSPKHVIRHMPAPAGAASFLLVASATACCLAATSALPGLHARALLKAASACSQGIQETYEL